MRSKIFRINACFKMKNTNLFLTIFWEQIAHYFNNAFALSSGLITLKRLLIWILKIMSSFTLKSLFKVSVSMLYLSELKTTPFSLKILSPLSIDVILKIPSDSVSSIEWLTSILSLLNTQRLVILQQANLPVFALL